MKKHSKRYTAAAKPITVRKEYSITDAVGLVKQGATAKFPEAVDIAVRLGLDPRKADQALRGTVSLPHGIGKKVRVLVIAKPPKDEEAKAAGADHVGYKDYLEKIQGGWADIDVIIAHPM